MTITSRRMFNFALPVLSKAAALSSLLVALCTAPAFADDLADVSRLVRGGQYAEALGKADAFLSKNPRDAQMRFLKGVILTEQNKTAEAIVVFTKLTEEFPTLPEPYNNLAVLYAAAGQYDKARTALDAAIRTNPTYATAYENLGDIHAKLASQAYDKALQLDSGNSAAKSKLTMVRTLVGNGTGTGPSNAKAPVAAPTPPLAAKPAPQIAQAPQPPAPPPVAAATPVPAKPAAPAAPAPSAPVVQAPKPAPVPSAPVASAKPEPVKPAAKAAPDVNGEKDEILSAVNGWAKAWSSRDVKSYLNFYGNDFETPNGQARKAWEQDRRARIVGKGRIEVKVEEPRIEMNGGTATAKFRQVYLSDRLTATTRKTLILTKRSGKWQIQQEQASK
jgi:Flp pilus assembly protein TadD/ketosteroid isomerase-like protein